MPTQCYKLAKLDEQKQREFIRSSQLCYGCLKPGHIAKQCRNRASCTKCSKRHPTVLPRADFKPKPESSDGAQTAKPTEKVDKTHENVTLTTTRQRESRLVYLYGSPLNRIPAGRLLCMPYSTHNLTHHSWQRFRHQNQTLSRILCQLFKDLQVRGKT